MTKPKILVLLGCYLPGFRSGGPVRTISAMVEALAPHFDVRIITLNHDSGSSDIYDSVRTGAWNQVGSAQVYYIPRWSLSAVRALARETAPDIIYMNGFFATSSIYGLVARRLGLLPKVPVVLATRGDLALGALGLKAPKKRLFKQAAKLLGLYRGLRWHASSDLERSEMLAQVAAFGVRDSDIGVAPDLGFGYGSGRNVRPEKKPGEVRFVTLGRITRMKNLPFALERMAELKGIVSFDIFGPNEDKELWSECEKRISRLPGNVEVRYHGAIDPADVLGAMSERHFFVLPTLGENYGHVIIEAAASGCPVVISDRTQWSSLDAERAGWDIPLEKPAEWNAVLQRCVEMDGDEYRLMSERAEAFGNLVMNSRANVEANIQLFRSVLTGGAHERKEAASVEVLR
ncbi:MAG TPA: glycosyltransferase family 4 protein [Terriglobales bacterium]